MTDGMSQRLRRLVDDLLCPELSIEALVDEADRLLHEAYTGNLLESDPVLLATVKRSIMLSSEAGLEARYGLAEHVCGQWAPTVLPGYALEPPVHQERQWFANGLLEVAKRLASRDAQDVFYPDVHEDGTFTWHVHEVDGSTRPATPEESAEADRQFAEEWGQLQTRASQAWEGISADPGFRPIPMAKYLDFVRWKKGLRPGIGPSWGELMLLAAENVRETYGPRDSEAPDLVTLQQMAAIVNRSKQTLRRYLGELPVPKVDGGRGGPAEWSWAEVRPWLQARFGRELPETFPADRFRRS